MTSLSKRRSHAISHAYEKWGWFAVVLIWALTLLFAAALVLIALGTLIIYPFAGTEENTLWAMLVGVILLVGIVFLGFEIRNRRAVRVHSRVPE